MSADHQNTLVGVEENTDFEVRSLDAVCINESRISVPWWHNLKYLLMGLFFGILLRRSKKGFRRSNILNILQSDLCFSSFNLRIHWQSCAAAGLYKNELAPYDINPGEEPSVSR